MTHASGYPLSKTNPNGVVEDTRLIPKLHYRAQPALVFLLAKLAAFDSLDILMYELMLTY